MIDVNCHWTDEALKVAEQVRPYDLLWFEEPIWPLEDFESLAQVRKHSITIAPHCPYFGPGLLASMHITATLAEPTMIEYSFADLGANPTASISRHPLTAHHASEGANMRRALFNLFPVHVARVRDV